MKRLVWITFLTFCIVFPSSFADMIRIGNTYYSPQHFSMIIPDNYIPVNHNNWKKWEKVLPKSIVQSFEQGATREIIVHENDINLLSKKVTNTINNMLYVISVEQQTLRRVDVDAICDVLKDKEVSAEITCVEYTKYTTRKLQSISYHGSNRLSFIRTWISLGYKRHAFIIVADRWESMYAMKRDARKIIKFASTITPTGN